MTSKSSALFRSIAKARRSTRRFQPNAPIPPPILRDILSTTQTSPSGFNLQPTHAILVRSPEIKSRLASEAMLGAGNAYRTTDCSALAVFVADLEVTKRIRRIYDLEKKSGCRDPHYMAILPVASAFLAGEGHAATLLKQMATDALSPIRPMPSVESVESWSYKNAGMVAQTYVLAATSHGLGTCMMEGYDSRRAKEILLLPDRYAVPIMVATGYEYEGEGWSEGQRTPRLEMEEAFFGDTFGERLDVLDERDDNADEDSDSVASG